MIYIFLKVELHKRALRDRCPCDPDSGDYIGAHKCRDSDHVSESPLRWAIVRKRPRLVQYLLRNKIDGGLESGYWPALYWLLAEIEKPEKCNPYKWTSDFRIGKPEVEVVKLLFQLGVHPMDLSESGVHWPNGEPVTPPLPHLFRIQAQPFLRTFIKQGTDLDWTTSEGENVLHFAVKTMQYAMVKALLQLGVDPNVGGSSDAFHPLHRAITFVDGDYHVDKRRMIVQLLLNHGTSPNVWSPSHEHPLHRIISEFYMDHHTTLSPKHFTTLASRCQDVNIRNGQGKTALHLVMEQPKQYIDDQNCLWCAKILMDAGADPSLPDATGQTPFHSGIQKSKFGVGDFTNSPNFRALQWRWEDAYFRLHLATYYAVKLGRVDLIPARVKLPDTSSRPLGSHIRAPTVKIFLDYHVIVAPSEVFEGEWDRRVLEAAWVDWPLWGADEWAKWRDNQIWMQSSQL
ncbi:ankyrin [Mytilinidion resinicola]|uniref:Ankyrin n=1 Tax=Mytilinidion resinicola TaxID=574789 RepID=A0A6A6XXV1_9PEZI|nr:ankyrin [Mytilinidion resinicola]KAF2801260.1 ankyrin [Mytilinidion resinicola]